MEKFGKRFQGKVAIVTASTQGIGFSIAERLGSEGASVVVSSCRQDATPHLQKGSSVIFISSAAGYQPLASLAMYGVSKTALLGLTTALAAEMAPDTHVNCVALPTRFANFLTINYDEARLAIEEKILLNRLGTTEDMAAATAFLDSDDASYMTGETLVIAGGAPSRL